MLCCVVLCCVILFVLRFVVLCCFGVLCAYKRSAKICMYLVLVFMCISSRMHSLFTTDILTKNGRMGMNDELLHERMN